MKKNLPESDLLNDMELLYRQSSCLEHFGKALVALASMQKDLVTYSGVNQPLLITQHGLSSAMILSKIVDYMKGIEAFTEEDEKEWGKTLEDIERRNWLESFSGS